MSDEQPHIERIQAEVQEIAEVLSRRTGRPIVDVWNDSLSLHRVRYERTILPDKDPVS